MRRSLPAPPLLLITDRRHAALPLSEVLAQALAAGCRWIMLREKDLDRAALTALAAEIVEMARPVGARVLVNGDIEAAARAGAHGAHLQSAEAAAAGRAALGPDALIGVSAHAAAELAPAAESGADYATLSPIFATASKPGYGPELGLEGLRAACATAPLPVVALAGLTPGNAAGCLAAGAAGIAAMGGIMGAPIPAHVVGAFIEAIS